MTTRVAINGFGRIGRAALRSVIPELDGRLNAYAVRAPIPTGSLVDLTAEVERATTVAEPIVSADIVKAPFSAIRDAPLTTVMDRTQVKVVAWYDNESGYASRLVELAERALAPVGVTA